MLGLNLTYQHRDEHKFLITTAAFLALLYFCLTLAHFLLLTESYKWFLIAASLATFFICLGTSFWANKLSKRNKSMALMLLMMIATANSLLHIGLAADLIHATNIIVVLIAIGIVIAHHSHWLICIAFCWVGAALIQLTLPSLPNTTHYVIAMAMATLLSWFAHLARKELMDNQDRLALERDIAVENEDKAIAQANAKSAFLAEMSHELRSPLTGVLGMLELLADTRLAPKQAEYVGTATQSAESLLSLINDILDFSKIEAGKLQVEQTEFDLPRLIHDTIQVHRYAAEAKGLRLLTESPDLQNPNFLGDPLRISQILHNLLSNAVKFTRAGAIEVSYTVTAQGDNSQLDVAVRDSGIGIAGDRLESLFKSYTQEDASTSRRFGGTGLGLAITKRLCQLMSGDITVSSQKGHGATFRFHIPLKAGQARPVQSPETTQRRAEARLNNPHVLLVEDNMINQQVILSLLEGITTRVDIANDGLEALERLSEQDDYDLVLMDCEMPNLNGYEASERIRNGDAGSTYTEIPIIAMTANAMEGDREKCLAAGMTDYLSKPVSVPQLRSTLQRHA